MIWHTLIEEFKIILQSYYDNISKEMNKISEIRI